MYEYIDVLVFYFISIIIPISIMHLFHNSLLFSDVVSDGNSSLDYSVVVDLLHFLNSDGKLFTEALRNILFFRPVLISFFCLTGYLSELTYLWLISGHNMIISLVFSCQTISQNLLNESLIGAYVAMNALYPFSLTMVLI